MESLSSGSGIYFPQYGAVYRASNHHNNYLWAEHFDHTTIPRQPFNRLSSALR